MREFPPQTIINSNHIDNNSRLLCLVLTTPHNYGLRAVHVQATWGRWCSELGEALL